MKVLALFLAVAMLATAMISVESKANAASTSVHYDGKTLFEGFFFGRGPVAKLFGSYYKGMPKPTAEAIATQDAWTQQIAQKDPSFFQEFANDMYSGDRARVAEAFEAANWKLAEVMAPKLGLTPSELLSNAASGKGSAETQGYKYTYLDIAVIVVIFVVFVAYDPASPSSPADQLSGQDRLKYDRFINDVTTRLAG